MQLIFLQSISPVISMNLTFKYAAFCKGVAGTQPVRNLLSNT